MSSSDSANSSYSGSVGRSQEVTVYRTATGTIVAAIVNLTCWQGEHDTYDAIVFAGIKPCVEYLRERVPVWMLQGLMQGLGEEAAAEEVD